MAPEERTNNHLGSLPWNPTHLFCVFLSVRVAGGSRGKAGYLLEKEVGRGWSHGLSSPLLDSVFLKIKGRTLKDHKRDCHPRASFHTLDYMRRVVTVSSLASFLPWLLISWTNRQCPGIGEAWKNHARIDPLKFFLRRGHCLPETAPNLSPQHTLVQVHAACRWALHTSCGLRWNTCFWGFTPWDVRYDPDDKPSPANISPGKNTHLNFYIVSVTLAHMWSYFSFGDYIKQLVSARYYLSHGVFFCSFLFLH